MSEDLKKQEEVANTLSPTEHNAMCEAAIQERSFIFHERKDGSEEIVETKILESELTDAHLAATFNYLMVTFKNTPLKTQGAFIDWILGAVQDAAEKMVSESPIVTPENKIVGMDGKPLV